jgi:hypothetical protein
VLSSGAAFKFQVVFLCVRIQAYHEKGLLGGETTTTFLSPANSLVKSMLAWPSD